MLLAIDIGNTFIHVGLIKGQRIIKIYQIVTANPQGKLIKDFKKVCKHIKKNFKLFEGPIVCSVVPQALKIVEKVLKNEIRKGTIVLGRDLIVPISNRYHNPKQVGQDRLVCAYASMRLYGCPVLVIDLGTAITLDVVSTKQEYLGGIIVPGIRLSAESLFHKTALLPKVKISRPTSLIGKDTKASILSGIFYGYGAMMNGLIELIAKKFKNRFKVIVTGGYSDIMKHYIGKRIDVIDQHLVFRGLQLLWEWEINH